MVGLVGAIVACALLWPAVAAAETFTVNTTADEVDATLGNFTCFTAAEKCSLRAAVEEANASAGEFDSIEFEEGVFSGDGGSVIALGSALPTITDGIRLFGRECETEAGPTGPCVEVDGVPGASVIGIEGVEEAEVESVSLTGGEAGLATEATPRLRARANWFGVGLDGSAAGNAIGFELGSGSDNSRIGGEGPGTGNLFADNSEIGLSILGSSRIRVLGNRFGLDPGGGAAAANGTDLAIASEPGAPAQDNIVGTRVSSAAAATAGCDGGCNLVSGAGSNGIDLTGAAGSGSPLGTSVVGNQIGLGAAGVGSVPNAGAGVLVGAAPHTTVGGPRPEDANLIAGGSVAVEAGPEVRYLVVSGNRIGLAASASATPPAAGIDVDSEGIALAPEEAQVLDNVIGLEGGTGIAVSGVAGEVTGNTVSGAGVGIEVLGSETLVASNSVEAPTATGILIANGFNAVYGNRVSGSGGAGIRIQGGNPFAIGGNVVGGDSPASENAIDGSAGAAIEIVNLKPSLNEVGRNHGSGNGGLFVDLVAAPPDPSELEPGDPNNGILPPAIAAIAATAVAGLAEPGATVRVFRKQTSAPGEIESFLGQATADGVGNWSLSPATPLAPGSSIAASQTLSGGTSELEIAAVPPPDRGSPGATGDGSAPDRKPPRTRVLKQPRRVLAGHFARFSFTSNEPGSSFQCSLDGARFRSCSSPQRYRLSRLGKHLFRVRAVDPAGNVDPTPVRRRFEVVD
jgi:CSLREA domain-containing protein